MSAETTEGNNISTVILRDGLNEQQRINQYIASKTVVIPNTSTLFKTRTDLVLRPKYQFYALTL